MKVLVTGGAGYIGGFMTKRLLDEGYEVVVIDSLERGARERVDQRAQLVVGDLQDKNIVKQLFADNDFISVIHFAGYISMGESMQNPGIYFQNNIVGAVNLLEEIKDKKIGFIFSSTAGVYGNPIETPITEDHPKNPTNPYGESKLMVEKILSWYNKVYGTSFVALRYFNAAGAELDASMGESHTPETHIIPNVMKAVLESRAFQLFGTDYQTQDGTAVRDYIHVLDLVEAHVLAMKKMEHQVMSNYYNAGTGKGYSNKEVVKMIEKVAGIHIDVSNQQRRSGDAAVLIASSKKIQEDLGFSPRYSDLETIVSTAWEWHKQGSK